MLLKKKIAKERTRQLAIHRKDGRSLDAEPIYYTYAILDTTKPGPWKIRLAEDKLVSFEYQPFYIGKGTRGRLKEHLRNHALKKKSHKAHTIQAIRDKGYEPIVIQLSALEDEATALAKEVILIDSIGRRIEGKGPLANVTAGGEGQSKVKVTNKFRKTVSKNTRNTWANMTPEQRAARCRAIAEGRKNMSPEAKAARAAKVGAKTKAYMAGLSEKERKERSKKLSKAGKAHHASLTEKEKEAIARKKLDTIMNKSEEEKAATAAKTSASMKAMYANMTDKDWKKFSKLRSRGNRKAWATSRKHKRAS
ncbi:hypothetical protein [Burkholderia phage BCSR5]|nr:hypothetical protein [Burkholderia phage BCSR5]